MNKTAVITGAGSGVGRAIALKLVAQDWRVAIVGRRLEALQQTIQLANAQASRLTPHVCDVSDATAVAKMRQSVLAEFGEIELLVNAAGINVPQRAMEVLSLTDYHAMIATNLHGAYYCVQAFLPQMRTRRSGTIVNIVSDAGKVAFPKAGPGYAMSKFALAGLSQSLNAEERGNGIRTCAIFPGDIDTALLNQRPQPPNTAARAKMMQAEDIADCALLCINLPANVIVEEMLVRPR